VEAPDDGWLWHPKHVEQRTKENKKNIELLHLGILFIMMISVNGIWEQDTELLQPYIVQNISLVCTDSDTTQSLWFLRRSL
jgi:hypothetical protein